jgi:hypothetical protein
MSQTYEQVLAAARDRTSWVYLDVQPPRDAPIKQFVAFLFEPGADGQRPPRPQGQSARIDVTTEQARELLANGAEWKGPTHLRAEVLPEV